MESLGMVDSAKLAMGEVISTLKEYKSFKTLFVYMLAYFLFIDGINSVTALAGVFGKAVLGLTTFDLILTILIIHIQIIFIVLQDIILVHHMLIIILQH